jgi:hypothetical protein
MAITLNGTTGITTPAIDNQGNLSVDGGTIKLDGNYPVGTGNVALGDTALDSNVSGGYNTAIGNLALTSCTSNYHTVVGSFAGQNLTTALASGAIGAYALNSNTTGPYNYAFGNSALQVNTTGGYNTAIGSSALTANTTASSNTAVGMEAGYSNQEAGYNTFIGWQSGYTFNTTGNAFNTFVGMQSGYFVTTGKKNSFIGSGGGGYGAGYFVTTGSANTILGAYNGNQDGLDIRTSSNNIVLSDGDGNPRAIYQNNGSYDFWGFNLSDADDPAVYSYSSGGGASIREDGLLAVARNGGNAANFNRTSNDGDVILISQAGTVEGNISVSGTTVSYNGGHLARWSQLADNTRDNTLLKGTVLTNLDQMAVWGDEDNEQLNCMAKSSVEGDANVAGVFVNWDNDDDVYTNDMNIAMTGDMIIRIAQGTTVARGDLLMSAGDGTAKPQGDDIVRSKTIAKVTSTHVSHTYDDGSFCVPCVLMAC